MRLALKTDVLCASETVVSTLKALLQIIVPVVARIAVRADESLITREDEEFRLITCWHLAVFDVRSASVLVVIKEEPRITLITDF